MRFNGWLTMIITSYTYVSELLLSSPLFLENSLDPLLGIHHPLSSFIRCMILIIHRSREPIMPHCHGLSKAAVHPASLSIYSFRSTRADSSDGFFALRYRFDIYRRGRK